MPTNVLIIMKGTHKFNMKNIKFICNKRDFSQIDVRQVDLPDINNTKLEENVLFLIPTIGIYNIETPP